MADYIPSKEEIERAFSALVHSDGDTEKLFKKGKRTFVKILGGDVSTAININANLVTAAVLMKVLEKLEDIEKKLEN